VALQVRKVLIPCSRLLLQLVAVLVAVTVLLVVLAVAVAVVEILVARLQAVQQQRHPCKVMQVVTA
jgi:hypothetical protein